jgi:NOL1/NOP2/sun family putative RNA methylase
MKALIPDEYESFIEKIENESAVHGVRINTLKLPKYEESDFASFDITKIPYTENAYICRNHEGIGHTPQHHAGIFYMQDPGAMATLGALKIERGWRVLDACAAPGGKSGQIAAAIGDDGFLLSNEYVPKRAKILVKNFERLGIKNAFVSSLNTREFKNYYDAFFDLVLVDAPCSGEGMFRKSGEAVSEWSIENVIACATRQSEILDNTASLVRDGGYLLYSTCTYSLEENEMVIDAFLKRHRDFEICEVQSALQNVTADGIQFQGSMSTNLYKTRRFYPHRCEGEGQFLALLKRHAPNCYEKISYRDAFSEPTKTEVQAVEKFFSENLKERPRGKIKRHGDNLVFISHGIPLLPKSIFSAGVLIGEVRGNLLFPSHQFFSAYGSLFIRQIELSKNEQALRNYLKGAQLDVDMQTSGYSVVTYMGASIGGGKISGEKMNNLYPKGLREN